MEEKALTFYQQICNLLNVNDLNNIVGVKNLSNMNCYAGISNILLWVNKNEPEDILRTILTGIGKFEIEQENSKMTFYVIQHRLLSQTLQKTNQSTLKFLTKNFIKVAESNEKIQKLLYFINSLFPIIQIKSRLPFDIYKSESFPANKSFNRFQSIAQYYYNILIPTKQKFFLIKRFYPQFPINTNLPTISTLQHPKYTFSYLIEFFYFNSSFFGPMNLYPVFSQSNTDNFTKDINQLNNEISSSFTQLKHPPSSLQICKSFSFDYTYSQSNSDLSFTSEIIDLKLQPVFNFLKNLKIDINSNHTELLSLINSNNSKNEQDIHKISTQLLNVNNKIDIIENIKLDGIKNNIQQIKSQLPKNSPIPLSAMSLKSNQKSSNNRVARITTQNKNNSFQSNNFTNKSDNIQIENNSSNICSNLNFQSITFDDSNSNNQINHTFHDSTRKSNSVSQIAEMIKKFYLYPKFKLLIEAQTDFINKFQFIILNIPTYIKIGKQFLSAQSGLHELKKYEPKRKVKKIQSNLEENLQKFLNLPKPLSAEQNIKQNLNSNEKYDLDLIEKQLDLVIENIIECFPTKNYLQSKSFCKINLNFKTYIGALIFYILSRPESKKLPDNTYSFLIGLCQGKITYQQIKSIQQKIKNRKQDFTTFNQGIIRSNKISEDLIITLLQQMEDKIKLGLCEVDVSYMAYNIYMDDFIYTLIEISKKNDVPEEQIEKIKTIKDLPKSIIKETFGNVFLASSTWVRKFMNDYGFRLYVLHPNVISSISKLEGISYELIIRAALHVYDSKCVGNFDETQIKFAVMQHKHIAKKNEKDKSINICSALFKKSITLGLLSYANGEIDNPIIINKSITKIPENLNQNINSIKDEEIPEKDNSISPENLAKKKQNSISLNNYVNNIIIIMLNLVHHGPILQ